ncbi:hypothetical protein [Owenweeksia hongkongensis]|uniref:hypothetical protein n=1 Tax=Owenweeksia hongkongensis TaxID=253245 RepID=UPI003A8CEE73
MTTYSQREIVLLIERFEAEKLPKAEWTHEAHLVVAIWYCSKFDFNEALPLVRKNISRHNTSVGTPNTDNEGYHETITKFWLLVANDFLNLKKTGSISELCNAFIQSPYGKSSYPLEFYSTERLFSAQARHHWLEPDLKEINLFA